MGEVDAFAPVAGGPGQFRSVQSAEEAGDLVLGPPSREWDETLGAGGAVTEDNDQAACETAGHTWVQSES